MNKFLNRLNLIQGAGLTILGGLGIAGSAYIVLIFLIAKSL